MGDYFYSTCGSMLSNFEIFFTVSYFLSIGVPKLISGDGFPVAAHFSEETAGPGWKNSLEFKEVLSLNSTIEKKSGYWI
jgi:hypothetical protein